MSTVVVRVIALIAVLGTVAGVQAQTSRLERALGVEFAGPETKASTTGPKVPLLIPGKKALYERVLTRPGAILTGGPRGGAQGKPIPPFSVLYVYERLPIRGGAELLAVGPNARGNIWGFVDAAATVPWHHALVMEFTARAARDRVLFFRDRDNLQGWLQRPDLSQAADQIRGEADTGAALGADSPIVSIEPREFVDFSNTEQFYILPILQADWVRLPSRDRVKAVRIASVTLQERTHPQPSAPVARSAPSVRPPPAAGSLGSLRVGLTFIIDASSSMQPYIDDTRQVVHEVLGNLEAAGVIDAVGVGVVGYRDDPTKVRGIEYLAQTFANPNDAGVDFLRAVSNLRASPVSTRAFAEDAFAGIRHSLERIDWQTGFDGRILVLITDASAREASSPYTAVGLNAEEMRSEIQVNSRTLPTAVYVLHLKTPEGERDHAVAASQYKELSRMDTGQSLYFGVELGDRAAFRDSVATLSYAIVDELRRFRGAGPPGETLMPVPVVSAAAVSAGGALADLKGLRASVGAFGRAMALAYLGRAAGTQAPSMFEAWASDRDFDDPTVKAFTVRVLLSKSQTSDLEKSMLATFDALNEAQNDPQNFFNQLKTASAKFGRNPDQGENVQVKNLAASGLMGEYLDGLPYLSRLMTITEDDWMRMGVTEQQDIIDSAWSKIEFYQGIHDSPDAWIPLHDDDHPDDYVYPIPLDRLP